MSMRIAPDGVSVYRGRFESEVGTPIADATDWYGVEWTVDSALPLPGCTRIGSLALHLSLPVQNGMYGCLLNDDGTENYKLFPTNWAFKEDGVTPSVLDGTDGQVMVYIPGFYFRHEVAGAIRRWKISNASLPGFDYEPPQYVSAYEAAADRTATKLASVINTTTQYRGGNNTSAWDGTHRSLLGRPVTNLTRTQLRSYARGRGLKWEMYNYWAHRAIMILFVVEYATRDSQATYNAATDIFGLKQGGLGIGCTNLEDAKWNSWNSYNPFLPCGHSNYLGNGTGESAVYGAYADGSGLTIGNRYRGIENPFGHIWKNCDGINYRNNDSNIFVSRNTALWGDTDYAGMDNIGVSSTATAGKYITEMLAGHVIPVRSGDAGAASTQFWCDYWYKDGTSVALRIVLFGGSASFGAFAGLGCSGTDFAPTTASAKLGTRLCFIPA